MILILSSSNREAAALTALCEYRAWAAYGCATIREFTPLAEKVQPRAIVVRQRLIDGYSDDLLANLHSLDAAIRPKVIVLMSADRSSQAEARQVALGADCVLHDPVRMDILLEYLARYRTPSAIPATARDSLRPSFRVAGVAIYPHEHYIERNQRKLHIAPQEVSLLRMLFQTPAKVVPYELMYCDLFGRRFEGDTTNCRVLLGKVTASFKRLGVDLKKSVQVIPKSGYLYLPPAAESPPPPPPSRRVRARLGRRKSDASRN